MKKGRTKAMLATGCLIAAVIGISKGYSVYDSDKMESDVLMSGDIEALGHNEAGSNNPIFKTWVDTGKCMEMRNGKNVEIGSYRICGEVRLGFSHHNDCSVDEECEKGEKE